MHGQDRIDQMYAFVVVDADGTEGVVGFRTGEDSWMPMVGADLERVEQLRPIAQNLATMMRKEIKVVLFDNRTDTETIRPAK